MAGHSRRMTFYGAAVVIILLVVATIAAQTPTGELLRPLESRQSETAVPPGSAPQPNQEQHGDEPFAREDVPEEGFSVLNVLLLFLLGVMIALFVSMFVGERERLRRRTGDVIEIDDADHRGSIRDVTAMAIDEALDRLDSGIAADHAIIECWRTLSTTVARRGLPQDPAWTSSELVAVICEATPAAPSDVTELAGLYRAARYSGRLTTDSDVAQAHACLTAIQGALR